MIAVRHLWRRTRKGVVAAGTLAAVAACAIGVPMPQVVNKPYSAERYPCEHHACGCVDAEACWHDCCCMTHIEKIAWAKREGVTPPEFAIAAAAREIAASRTQQVASHSCCDAKKQASGCCSAKGHAEVAQASTCCEKVEACCEESEAPRGYRIISLHAAMGCRGLTVSVSLLPPSLPVTDLEFLAPPLVRFASFRVESLLYESPTLGIATPPPDCAAT